LDRQTDTAAGSSADLVVLDYIAPTPLPNQNLLGHFCSGYEFTMVHHVMVMENLDHSGNKQLFGINEESGHGKAQKAAAKLWKKMGKN